MKPIVFAGPSLRGLPPATRERIDLRGPAACGDIARAVLAARTAALPRAIGLIDGLFETTAAPWHKEILWAMAQGVAVFGAASMGALRAAELAPIGMIGLGHVFTAYHTGALEADDEVAVQHGPAELGFPPLSEALVNIRASLAAARQTGVIGADDAARLLATAQRLFFKHRTWERILADDPAAPALRAWLPEHGIDWKHDDALALVDAVLAFDGPPPAPPAIPETFLLQALLARLRA